MAISKVRTIKVSERVFDLVDEQIEMMNEDDWNLGGYLETFYNCREQGYCAHIYDKDDFSRDNLYIFAFEARSSDAIVVIISTVYPAGGMFNDDDYNNRKLFGCNCYSDAAEYIIKNIKKHFTIE